MPQCHLFGALEVLRLRKQGGLLFFHQLALAMWEAPGTLEGRGGCAKHSGLSALHPPSEAGLHFSPRSGESGEPSVARWHRAQWGGWHWATSCPAEEGEAKEQMVLQAAGHQARDQAIMGQCYVPLEVKSTIPTPTTPRDFQATLNTGCLLKG